MKVGHLVGRESQALLFVILFQVVHVFYWFGLSVNAEEFFYTRNAVEIHVLRNLNGICAPWRHHLAARSHVKAFKLLCVHQCSVAVQPCKFGYLFIVQLVINFSGYHRFFLRLEKKNHLCLLLFYKMVM